MWNYSQPVKIIFGNGQVEEIKNLMNIEGWENGLIVAAPNFISSGLTTKLMEESKGRLTAVFADFSPNPDVVEVDACAALIRKNGHGCVVALGGGSAMDLAKAAASSALAGDSIKDYHGTGKALPPEHLPLIALPTTAGTGSEVTCVSVLTDHELGKKVPIVSENFYPDYAVIDPELTYSMPSYVTACSGMDVLAHAIEGYWSKAHQPICDACAIQAIRLALKYLYRAFTNPNDAEAREKMCEASLIAGLAFTLPKTTSAHACSYPLTNIYGIAHGEACALTLDYFMRVNAENDDGRMRELAQALGYDDMFGLADTISGLKQKLQLRCDMKDFKLSKEKIDELVQTSHHPNMLNNPVTITDDILYDMYNKLAEIIN